MENEEQQQVEVLGGEHKRERIEKRRAVQTIQGKDPMANIAGLFHESVGTA